MMKARSALTTLLLMNAMAAIAEPRYIPVASGLFSVGQWYAEGKESSLGGNAALSFIPALQYSSEFSLIPTFESSYQGTRSAEELAGGDTFFQDTWTNGASIKAVHSLSEEWTLRERVGFHSIWFRETTDERWRHGLYDYRYPTVGAEVERAFAKQTHVALSYDFSYLQFPNYSSLESQQSSDNAREFSGTHVLDSRVNLLAMRVATPLFWKMQSNLQVTYSPRDYIDQHVVVLTGELTPTRRRDTLIGSSLGLDRTFHLAPSVKLLSNVQYSYATFDSNQNHYDAQLTTFIPNYYDYWQNAIGTQLTLAFGKKSAGPMLMDVGYNYSYRDYRSRVIQAPDGTYLGEKLYQIEQSIDLGFSYPLTHTFRVRTTANFSQSKSNNDYEAVYRYNYHNANYQFGFTYDY